MNFQNGNAWYGAMILLGVTLSLFSLRARLKQDQRLFTVYFFGLMAAFLAAKIVFLAAEAWYYKDSPDLLLRIINGKSILGGLIGGYAGIELGKRLSGYSEITGDRFASIIPLTLLLGRTGCLMHGCCLGSVCPARWYSVADSFGISRYPIIASEIVFNFAAFLLFDLLRKHRILATQHFHLYLISYGCFRFFQEFFRDTPRVIGPFSGYHFFSIGLIVLGYNRFLARSSNFPGPR